MASLEDQPEIKNEELPEHFNDVDILKNLWWHATSKLLRTC